jgi:N-sulfoglucosamine sulfohydrolase
MIHLHWYPTSSESHLSITGKGNGTRIQAPGELFLAFSPEMIKIGAMKARKMTWIQMHQKENPMSRCSYSWRLRLVPVTFGLLTLAIGWLGAVSAAEATGGTKKRPNILIAIADDQSFPHCGAGGCPFVKTPAFDKVAKNGVLFRNGYAASCGCSPSRASLLTGRHTWQLEQAGTHASSFPNRFVSYPDLLEQAGYVVGFTGKPWGPGNWKAGGWKRNPAGPDFNAKKLDPPAKGVSGNDYYENFKVFLKQRPKEQPFCFWFGASEPHRAYEKGIGLKSGKKHKDVEVPPFLPDTDEIRSDLLDYAFEIEWFDQHLGKMIQYLEEIGELDNTIIIVTADNGMPFPRAKANLYDYGIHVPFAACWHDGFKGGRVVDDLVGFADVAPTLLEAAGLNPHQQMSGKSFLNVLRSDKSGQVDPDRIKIFSARERHSSSRVMNLGYPSRCMRKGDFLIIRNFAPDLWPAGDPRGAGGDAFGYYDIDGAPSKTFLVQNKEKYQKHFDWAVAKRPEVELFDVKKDSGCLNDLAADPRYAETLKALRAELEQYLRETGDPRMLGNGDIWESYPRYSPIREFTDKRP